MIWARPTPRSGGMESLIASIGRPDFSVHCLDVYRQLANCDFCSVFIVDTLGPRLLFAEGTHETIPNFAQEASLAYANRYWQQDIYSLHDGSGTSDHQLNLVTTSPSDIHDQAYRAECYDRPGVVERLAITSGAGRGYLINGYRTTARGRASPAELERFVFMVPLLMSAVQRHDELLSTEPTPIAACRKTYTQRALDRGLSEREACVVAALAAGDRQTDIADTLDVAIATIVTYRRRAYRKLGVADRRELRQLLEIASDISLQ